MARRRWSPLVVPHELIHFWIIPYLLSEHLHHRLISGWKGTWNPFWVLPLVSRDFWSSCRSHNRNIFGLRPGATADLAKVLKGHEELWKQANGHPWDMPDMETFAPAQLAITTSLLNIYACAAYAKMYLTIDVYRPIIKESYTRDTGFVVEGWEPPHEIHNGRFTYVTRSYRMKDHRMHRLFSPLNVAIEQCDKISPSVLAYEIANYLAGIIPKYAALPTMLKNAQDLEAHLFPSEGIDKFHLLDWTRRALNLIDGTRGLIIELQQTGRLVQSFTPTSDQPIIIPKEAIEDTRIIDILDVIALSEWGADSREILEWANDARDDLLQL